MPPHNRFLGLSSWQVIIKSNKLNATQSLMQKYVCLPMMLTKKVILKYFLFSLVLIIVSSIDTIVICLNKMVSNHFFFKHGILCSNFFYHLHMQWLSFEEKENEQPFLRNWLCCPSEWPFPKANVLFMMAFI
jgi:hypothetical protein